MNCNLRKDVKNFYSNVISTEEILIGDKLSQIIGWKIRIKYQKLIFVKLCFFICF
jgi:hypothetical protein